MTYKRILVGLAAFLALAGVASAQSSCPECDEDGESTPDNTYHSVDVGALENETNTTALADTDASHGHDAPGNGFWAWLSICLSAIVGEIEDLIGLDLGIDANVEVYASEDGVDLDATAYVGEDRLDFDDSAAGDLDGATWETMSTVNAARNGTETPELPRIPEYDGVDADVCIYADTHVAGC